MKKVHGVVASVDEESPAYEAGIRAGDEIESINGHKVRDILDYNYLCMDEELAIRVRRGERSINVKIDMSEEDDPGIEFQDDLFDGVHTCRNNCIFCFLHQMPKGLRSSLYVSDDDYRLSLAHGNYITLTNLSYDDMDRICAQRMSPIYVSVHTTDPLLRESMLRTKAAGRIMDQLKRLADARITMHTQIVLCRDVNDGENLARTVHDLAGLYPRVASIGVVPVGLTKDRERLYPLKAFDRETSAAVVNDCTGWQKEFRKAHGSRLVWPSDEFYIQSGIEIPGAAAYEEFPQIENGIGLCRVFLDELKAVGRNIAAKRLRPGKYVLVTGVLAESMVRRLSDALSRVEGVTARVCVVKNKFLGESVTVAGLLCGADVIDALQDVSSDEEVLIPDIMLNEERFLDDVTLEDVKRQCRGKVTEVCASPKSVVRYLRSSATS
ncbi:MAG TPA: DUF512 domain-containing protein [Armatimonadota bacterium]